MQLLVVRHAIACVRNARRWPDDRERPLSSAGAQRAHRAARGLKQFAPRPGCVLTSPLTRARQTAAILHASAGWPAAVACAALAPGTSPRTVLAILRRRKHAVIAVVGHQPDLGQLLAACLGGERAWVALELRKPAVACLGFAGGARAGGATLRWLVPPRLLRALS